MSDHTKTPIIPIFQVDAFTDVPFQGNPAAVCYLMQSKSSHWMQQVAAEMNLAETAFFILRDGTIDLRWFTPTIEVDLCGHATLATAHIIWETELRSEERELVFDTRSGILRASKAGDWISLDFPSIPVKGTEVSADWLEKLGLEPVFVGKSKFDLLIELASEQEVREYRPDFRLIRELDARGLMITARGANGQKDFVSRFFAPQSGIDEDPVTGSAHCCLGTYWMEKLGKKEMIGYQASPRGGMVKVKVNGERTLLQGKAVTVMQGVLTVK
ncbi:MAG: PhzF family phenazine biosynthesis protein [Bacteroidia bacterium]|nr:PhzF family phenazine biosynthesis protein [Bacteroidia bacterium]